MANLGEDQFTPTFESDAFIPDRLIAGDLKLVTADVIVTGAAKLERGTVLGRITLGASDAAADGGNTGDGTLTLDGVTPVLAYAVSGVYTVICTHAAAGGGTFQVTDPDGNVLGSVAVGATFANQIKFAIAAGGTDFIVGDKFTVTIDASVGKYQLSVETAMDGSQNPVAILVDEADATSADVAAGAYLMGEFNGDAIIFDASWTLASVTAALRPVGIFIKAAVDAADPS